MRNSMYTLENVETYKHYHTVELRKKKHRDLEDDSKNDSKINKKHIKKRI